jgi:hypothetical protein
LRAKKAAVGRTAGGAVLDIAGAFTGWGARRARDPSDLALVGKRARRGGDAGGRTGIQTGVTGGCVRGGVTDGGIQARVTDGCVRGGVTDGRIRAGAVRPCVADAGLGRALVAVRFRTDFGVTGRVAIRRVRRGCVKVRE